MLIDRTSDNTVAIAYENGIIEVYDISSNKHRLIKTLGLSSERKNDKIITNCLTHTINRNGDKVIVSCEEREDCSGGFICFWDINRENGSELVKEINYQYIIGFLTFLNHSPNVLICGSTFDGITIYTLDDNYNIVRSKEIMRKEYCIRQILLKDDDKIIAITSGKRSTHYIRLCDINRDKKKEFIKSEFIGLNDDDEVYLYDTCKSGIMVHDKKSSVIKFISLDDRDDKDNHRVETISLSESFRQMLLLSDRKIVGITNWKKLELWNLSDNMYKPIDDIEVETSYDSDDDMEGSEISFICLDDVDRKWDKDRLLTCKKTKITKLFTTMVTKQHEKILYCILQSFLQDHLYKELIYSLIPYL